MSEPFPELPNARAGKPLEPFPGEDQVFLGDLEDDPNLKKDETEDSGESGFGYRSKTLPSRPQKAAKSRDVAPPLTLAQQKLAKMQGQLPNQENDNQGQKQGPNQENNPNLAGSESGNQGGNTYLASNQRKIIDPNKKLSKDQLMTLQAQNLARALVNEPKNPWGDNQRRNTMDTNKKSWFKKEDIIGYYSVGKTIGSGGVGSVRKGTHLETGQKFAIKQIDMDEKKKKFIQREIAISRLLDHPNIVRMYDVIYQDFNKQVYMVFDLVDGGALLDFIISHNYLTENLARPFFRQILSAVAYCHQNSIAHRDLKIENILIDKKGKVKLIDFGLANLYNPRDFLLTNCGSIYFAAPELLQKLPYVGPEVDMWSMGVILFVMLYGRVPFEDKTLARLYEKIKKGDLRFPAEPQISKDAENLIRSMLKVDRTERATLEQVMQNKWVNDGYPAPPKDEVPSRSIIEKIDPDVVAKMTEFGFDEKEVERVLKEAVELKIPPTELHPIRSIYYMTKEKLERDRQKMQNEFLAAVGVRSKQTISEPEIDESLHPSIVITPTEETPIIDKLPKRVNLIQRINQNSSEALNNPNPVIVKTESSNIISRNTSSDEGSGIRTRSSSSISSFSKRFSIKRNKNEETRNLSASSVTNQNDQKPNQETAKKGLGNQLSIIQDEESSTSNNNNNNLTTKEKEENNNEEDSRIRKRSSTYGSEVKNMRPRASTNVTSETSVDFPTKPLSEKPSEKPELIITDPHAPPVTARENEPRVVTLKGFFSVSNTSNKQPFLIKDEIERVLGNKKIKFVSERTSYDLYCVKSLAKEEEKEGDAVVELETGKTKKGENNGLKFVISVVKVQLMGMHGVKMKKISGDAWAYKSVCSEILNSLKL